MNGRVYFAIFCGALIGGAIVHVLAEAAGWYFVGGPAGGIAGWLVYAWHDIKRQTPAVWKSVSSWRPDTERYWAWATYIFWCAAAAASFALNALVVMAGIMLWRTDIMLSHAVMGSAGVAGAFLVFGWLWAISSDHLGSRKGRTSVLRINTVARKKRDVVLGVSPIGVACLIGLGVVMFVRALPTIGRFLVALFVRVHSNDALDCFFYAAVGVLIGALTTQTIWVMAISATVGLGLAFVFRMLARWVKSQWPAFA
ncbi:MAG: hypothetical protein WDZ93_02230 [Candidatus Paceibacterota bacterium]